jgi:hypothetical protein
MIVVHLGRLKAPREAAGQMDLLTVPSHDYADLMVKQVEEALSASSGDRQGPNENDIPQRQTGVRWRERETHGVMPNPRQVPSEGQRSLSMKNALCKGFETMMT